jgi:hypothetical protein
VHLKIGLKIRRSFNMYMSVIYPIFRTHRFQGDNPLTMWRAFLQTPTVLELADFAILLLGTSVNQAGLGHSFSDLKIKKTWLWNHLTLPRLKKMAKVGANICISQKEAGFIEVCMKCQNHDKAKVVELLSVPHYADVLDEGGNASDDESALVKPQSGLVKSCTAWQKEMVKWVQEEQDQSDDEDDNIADIMYGHQHAKWLP